MTADRDGAVPEMQSQPRVLRRSLSLTRSSSDSTLTSQPTANRRAAGSHAALFASARALGGSGGSAASCTATARRTGTAPLLGYPPKGAPKAAVAAAAPLGISAAFLLTFMSRHGPQPDMTQSEDSDQATTTRAVARSLKRRMKDAQETGPHVESLVGQMHSVTGGPIAGSANVHVAHAWDSNFPEFVDTLVADSQGDLDKRYSVDVFCSDLFSGSENAVTTLQGLVAGADTVLLLVDAEGQAFRRLWVIFEAMLAFLAGKLRMRCTSPGGFGTSEAALKAWEARIDSADWALAEAVLKSDEKRLRSFAEREWEIGGKGIERMMAQLRKALRTDAYSQILIGAVVKGDKSAVLAALDLGADPEVLDTQGNTCEAVAAFNGRKDIEDLIFERRMRLRSHMPLAEWALDPQQLASSQQAGEDILFVTEYLGGRLGPEETGDSEEERFIAGELLHLSEQSTCTPNLSSRAESAHDA